MFCVSLPPKLDWLFNQIALKLSFVDFIWIGDGELKNELSAPNITITGWVTREYALQIMSLSDLFILPSLWEGLPISLLEAMFLKKVCLVSNVVGNRDVINNMENGFICNTVDEYVNRIKDVIDKNKYCELITQNAHDDILHNYDIERMSMNYSLIYKQNT